MKITSFLCVSTLLATLVQVLSEEVDDYDIMPGFQDANYHLESMRMTRAMDPVYDDGTVDDRSLLREERRRLRAERRRLKEERRMERWAKKRQKQAGQQDPWEEGDDHEVDRDIVASVSHVPQHSIPGTFTRPSSISGPLSSPGVSSQPSSALATSSHSVSSSYPSIEAVPEVVDLEWVRANLSTLWTVVRTLARQQGRILAHRGGAGGGSKGRHHHSGRADVASSESCPGTEDACRGDGGEICGGKGSCTCGHCFCESGFYGTYCQCNDHSCPIHEGMICGGPSRGQCRCGGCVCRPGYTGESCYCSTDSQGCKSPDRGEELCSNNGICECGQCRCNDGHKGKYCEESVYAAGVCEKLKTCVMCRAWNRDLPSCANCQIIVTTVESLEPSMTTCVMVNSGCLLQFSYIPQTADAYTVLVPRDMVCPT